MYLRCKDTILAIVCTGLPITPTTAGEWLISLIFYDDIKCITANRLMIIISGIDNVMWQLFISHRKCYIP